MPRHLSRATIRVVLAAVAAAMPHGLSAQDYPSRSVRFLQGFAPGGNADIISRVIGDELQSALGRTIIYESRAGAGGNLASEAVAKADPDGHTLVLLTT